MKPKLLPLLEECIEDGIMLGYSRAFKHEDNPSDEYIQQCIHLAIMSEIYSWFEFEDSLR